MFLSLDIALCLYKFIMQSCMEYFCHDWGGAPSCCLDMLDKVQKQVCRTVVLLLAACLDPLIMLIMNFFPCRMLSFDP